MKWREIYFSTTLLVLMTGCSRSLQMSSTNKIRVRLIDGMEMVYAHPGAFEMGSTEGEIHSAFKLCAQYWEYCDQERFSDELPQHSVELDGYWIDRTEITNEQYRKCVEEDVCDEPACWSGLQFDDAQQPVVCVTWDQAQSYCEWVGGRLPTEAEWEYAARGSDNLLYPWGNSFVGIMLNYCDATCGRPRSDPEWNDGQYYSARVGSYPDGASWCGALDMAGNVSEWTADWYGAYVHDRQVNPLGPTSGTTRTIRGGSWFLTPIEARTAWREGNPPKSWFDDIGFRCLIPVLQSEQ